MRSTTRPAKEGRTRRGAGYGALLVGLIVVGLLARSAVAHAGVTAAFGRSLGRIDTQLRLAIESRPGELGEYVRSSDIICGLAERSQARGDVQGSESDWSTLSHAVHELDYPASDAVDAAFADADSSLAELRRTFSARWHRQPSRVRELARGVAWARHGVHSLRSAIGTIRAAFAYWDQRQCAAADRGIEAGVGRISAGVDQVNLGMLRLFRLSGR